MSAADIGAFTKALSGTPRLVNSGTARKCRIRVDNTITHSEEGVYLLFDDTYDHGVWNDIDSIRIVLFMDTIWPMSFSGFCADFKIDKKLISGRNKNHTKYIYTKL